MHSSGIFRPLYIAITVLLLLFPLITPSAQQPNSPKPFSKNEIIRLLKGDVPGNRVAALARERGIEFQMNQENEAEIRQAGANDSLVAALRALAPKPVAPLPASPAILAINSMPGGARVYIDDEPVGTTSPEGRFKMSTLAPGKHHLRLALDGYLDREQDIELTRGDITNADLALDLRPTATPAPPGVPAPEAVHASDSVGSISRGVLAFQVADVHPKGLPSTGKATLTVDRQGVQFSRSGNSRGDLRFQCSDIAYVEYIPRTPYLSLTLMEAGREYDFAVDYPTKLRPTMQQEIIEAVDDACGQRTFWLIHKHGSGAFAYPAGGVLTVYSRGIHFYENDGHHAHDLSLSCSEINTIKATGDNPNFPFRFLFAGREYVLNPDLPIDLRPGKEQEIRQAIETVCGQH
jgi:hypothetical protein